MKKLWLAVGAAAVCGALAFVLFRLGRTPTLETPVQNTVTLPVMIAGGDASWSNCVSEIAALYMKQNPDVKVEVRATSNIEDMDYSKQLLIEEAMGNFDGIVELMNTHGYADEGKLLPLPQTLTDQFREVKVTDGAVYSLPRYFSCRGIVYNQAVFDRLHLKRPQTYQEFLSLCQSLKSAGVTPLTVGAGDLWHLAQWANALYSKDVKAEIPDWMTQRSAGTVHWTDEGPRQMLSDFQDLFARGYVDVNYVSTTDAGTIEKLTEEKAAMLCSGTWMFSQILKTSPSFELGWFFLPNDGGEQPLVELNDDWQWGITASCAEEPKVYNAAVDFLAFFYSEEIYPLVLQNMSGFSAVSQTTAYETVPIQKEIAALVDDRGQMEGETWASGDMPDGFSNQLYPNLLALAQGEQSVDETAAALDCAWEECFERTK